MLHLGRFFGNTEDAMRNEENMKFTTFDRDNDHAFEYNCASRYRSGWWFRDCYNG
ncbi:hypothetical protein KR093_010676 [Drosophila rubida]|uniref:Fibrinogen C-terminal domain-containing protein n=1 Tax=Drosophila rubida TaxID=30044 RepID=A0AAD4PM49_9MUSC|nr:hypothetical protein KR093_010676 [Drosophila rubida]